MSLLREQECRTTEHGTVSLRLVQLPSREYVVEARQVGPRLAENTFTEFSTALRVYEGYALRRDLSPALRGAERR